MAKKKATQKKVTKEQSAEDTKCVEEDMDKSENTNNDQTTTASGGDFGTFSTTWQTVPQYQGRNKPLPEGVPEFNDPDFEWESIIPSYYFYEVDTPDGGKEKRILLKGLLWLARSFGYTRTWIKDLTITKTDGGLSTAVVVGYKMSDGTECEALAEANPLNLDEKMSKFASTMAETRARARCIRFFFGITTCSVEEDSINDELDTRGLDITPAQKTTIKNMMKRSQTDLKTINDEREKYSMSRISGPEDLDYQGATKLIKWLVERINKNAFKKDTK